MTGPAIGFAQIPMSIGVGFSGLLFVIGVVGLLVRRNVLFTLMSIEMMLNAAGAAFVIVGSRLAVPDGQVMFVFILAVAAAEVSVGLGIVLRMHAEFEHLDVDETNVLETGGRDG